MKLQKAECCGFGGRAYVHSAEDGPIRIFRFAFSPCHAIHFNKYTRVHCFSGSQTSAPRPAIPGQTSDPGSPQPERLRGKRAAASPAQVCGPGRHGGGPSHKLRAAVLRLRTAARTDSDRAALETGPRAEPDAGKAAAAAARGSGEPSRRRQPGPALAPSRLPSPDDSTPVAARDFAGDETPPGRRLPSPHAGFRGKQAGPLAGPWLGPRHRAAGRLSAAGPPGSSSRMCSTAREWAVAGCSSVARRSSFPLAGRPELVVQPPGCRRRRARPMQPGLATTGLHETEY